MQGFGQFFFIFLSERAGDSDGLPSVVNGGETAVGAQHAAPLHGLSGMIAYAG
jgi:hypothetical protein